MAVQAEQVTVTESDPGATPGVAPAADREVRRLTTVLLGGVVVLLVIVESVLLVASGQWDVTQLLLWQSTIILYCASGLLANWRQPHNPFGLLLIWAGLALWCAGLELAPYPAISLVGHITRTLPIAALVHLVLAYPYGRLPDRVSRLVVVTIYTVALVLQAPSYLFVGGSDFMIVELPQFAESARSVQRLVGVLGLGVGLWAVMRRRHLVGPDRRQRMGPLTWYGPVALVALISLSLAAGLLPGYREQIGILQGVVVLGLPILFLAGLLTGAFGRAGELREFLARVGDDSLQAGHLDVAVARALGDRSARVVYGFDAAGGYFNADGSPAPIDRHRTVMPVQYGGEVVGAIDYASNSVVDERLLDAVSRVCALAVDHHRVVAVLRAALLDLEESAAALRQAQYRLVRASDVERRRIARDLHDGVQQSIVVLGLRVRSLSKGADDPDRVRATAADLQRGMAELLADFRALVHGIMPASLTDRGIVSAIKDLGERTALPLVLRSSGLSGRLPAEIESTVYFVILETVTNAVKHAAATGIWVDLQDSDGVLCAEVRDDGQGGAALDGGSGLPGLLDRVLALNGTMTVNSAAGSGTVVRVLIPCG